MPTDSNNPRWSEISDRLARIEQVLLANATEVPAPKLAAIDPTANVIALQSASDKRQDDLRVSEITRSDEVLKISIENAQEIQDLHLNAQRDLSQAESRRIDALMLAESRRLDALLAAVQNNVLVANKEAAAVAATLAAQVATTANSNAAALNALRDSHDKRITSLEQTQYRGIGEVEQRMTGRQQNQWIIGVLAAVGIAIAGGIIGVAQIVARYLVK